jgi:hypothetical protein
MPPDLHGALAQAAEREGISLNGYITARLSESLGREGAENGSAPAGAPAAADKVVTRLLIANVVTVTLAALAAIAILLVAWLG